jgi:hypothetical protein
MIKEYFDVSRILSIFYRPEEPVYWISWVESKPIKKFFGLYNTGRFTEAGWFDNSEWDETTYTDDDMRKRGFIVYDKDERINDRICRKAYVKVYLTHDNSIEQSFDSDKQAEEWIETLKEKSGKAFEVVTYKR